MRPDEQLVMISAVEHYSYCPRQCGLIHVECVFDENVFTLRGREAHRRTHDEALTAWEDGVRVERGLPLWSARLGLTASPPRQVSSLARLAGLIGPLVCELAVSDLAGRFLANFDAITLHPISRMGSAEPTRN